MDPTEGTTSGTSNSDSVSTKLNRIAELARKIPGQPLITLAHHIDVDWLHAAYASTRKDGAAGIDQETARSYEKDLENNLQSLLDRFKSGRYKAPPVRRVHIPKGSGSETRPIGIPTFEDKVLQRAVTMVLEAVYEQEFRDSSYGFRPGRSAHQALEALRHGLMEMHGGVVLELDIEKFFDTLDHGHLRAFLDRRVRDGVLRRTIGKWLNAGVLEKGRVHHPKSGSPQGGVVSPILANVYLHEVLDVWFEDVVKPRLQGPAFLVRYADDAVIAFRLESDAKRVMEILPRRFEKYGLRLHSGKTRLVPFRRPRHPGNDDPPDHGGHPETFDFLGFTHYWGTSRRGVNVVLKKTARTRLTRALKSIGTWLRTHRFLSIDDQWATLVRKLRGHYAYFGVTGNKRALECFRTQVVKLWRKWLERRSQRGQMSWRKFLSLLERRPLPPAVLLHSVVTRAANP